MQFIHSPKNTLIILRVWNLDKRSDFGDDDWIGLIRGDGKDG